MSGYTKQGVGSTQAAIKRTVVSSTWQDILATLGGAAAGIGASAIFLLAQDASQNPLMAIPVGLALAASVGMIAVASSRYRKRRQARIAEETSFRIEKLISEQAPEAHSAENAAEGTAKVKAKLRSLRQAS